MWKGEQPSKYHPGRSPPDALHQMHKKKRTHEEKLRASSQVTQQLPLREDSCGLMLPYDGRPHFHYRVIATRSTGVRRRTNRLVTRPNDSKRIQINTLRATRNPLTVALVGAQPL